jgi:hypothetical protein
MFIPARKVEVSARKPHVESTSKAPKTQEIANASRNRRILDVFESRF